MDKKVKLLKEEVITFKRTTLLSLNESAELLNISKQAMHSIALKYELGKRIGNFFKIDPMRLKKYIENNPDIYQGLHDKKIEFNCPSGYHYGIDFDKNSKCKSCNTNIWLKCGEKHDKRERIKALLKNKNKIYNKRELEDKIKEMEKRL